MWFLLAVTIYAGAVMGTPNMSYVHSNVTMVFETQADCANAETELRNAEDTATANYDVVLSCTFSESVPSLEEVFK